MTTTAHPIGHAARQHLNGTAEILAFFRACTEPIYYVGPSFHLLGMRRWVPSIRQIAYYDPWDGGNPRVFAPKSRRLGADWLSLECQQVSNHLLRDPEVREHLRQRGGTPMIMMLWADEETEQICREQGYHLILPPAQLRNRLDSKLVTTRLADEAGVPSVPNVLGTAASYRELTVLAAAAGLGDDLVVQLPHGYAGRTTFFIATERDWNRCAASLSGQELKVMKRISSKALAVEACVTRHGTIVGPLMADLVGYPELTPHRGGWCGNDLFAGALPADARDAAIAYVCKLGDRLRREGYQGMFGVDVLVDTDSGAVYLGELNPRVCGIAPMTNATARPDTDVPLFLLHLLEFMDVDYTIDAEQISDRWRAIAAGEAWSQLIIKETGAGLERILAAPRAGTWWLADDGELDFRQASSDFYEIRSEDEVFFMPVCGKGDVKLSGADLGVLISRGRMEAAGRLTGRAQRFIAAICAQYRCEPVNQNQWEPTNGMLRSARRIYGAARELAVRAGVPRRLEEKVSAALWQAVTARTNRTKT